MACEKQFSILQNIMLVTIGLFSISLIEDGIAIGLIFTYKLPQVVWALMNISIWLKIISSFTVVTISVFLYLFDQIFIAALWMELLVVCGMLQICTMLATFSTSSSEHFEMEINAGHIVFYFIYLVTYVTKWSFIASNFSTVFTQLRKLQKESESLIK